MDDALDRGNYRGLKLTVQAMKVIERIAYSLVRQVIAIDWGYLGRTFMQMALSLLHYSMEEYVRLGRRVWRGRG